MNKYIASRLLSDIADWLRQRFREGPRMVRADSHFAPSLVNLHRGWTVGWASWRVLFVRKLTRRFGFLVPWMLTVRCTRDMVELGGL